MGARVLIVEDEPSIVESLRFILERAGHEVQTVTDGNAALALLRRRPADAVILDLMLPGPSGFEIFKQIRADPVLAATPVLMLTARGQEQDRRTAEALGVDAFISKPFSNREVVECVRRLLGGDPG